MTRQPDDGGEDDFAKRERHQQQVERQKQDESLDELHSAVKRLGDMSLSISTELDTQNKCVVALAPFVVCRTRWTARNADASVAVGRMLDELNEDTDKASETLQAVTKKTKELIEQSGTWSCGGADEGDHVDGLTWLVVCACA